MVEMGKFFSVFVFFTCIKPVFYSKIALVKVFCVNIDFVSYFWIIAGL